MVTKKLYFVVPCYNEEAVLAKNADKIRDKLEKLKSEERISTESKIVLVDDGSKDDTWKIICLLCERHDCFIGIRLSKNEGHQNALMAGLMYARNKCDVVITIDADLQQDINAADAFLEKFYEGNEIVYGVRNARDTDGFLKKTSAGFFYGFMKVLGCNVIKNHADYRLISAKALQALAEYGEVNLFLRGMIPLLGFQSCVVYFDVFAREAGKSKYTWGKMLKLALVGITDFSIKPMHIIVVLGAAIFGISIIMVLYNLLAFMRGQTVEGWTSLSAAMWGLSGIQLLTLGVIGEYIGKIYVEVKHRPRYIIENIIGEGNKGKNEEN